MPAFELGHAVLTHLVGLQNDSPDALITIDSDYLSRVMLRRSIIAKYPATAHGVTPRGVPAVQELYAYLMSRYLPSRYPSIFHVRDKHVQNSATGTLFPTVSPEDPLECLRSLSESVEEDMFLLQPTEKGHQCIAFVCCFPSGFNPRTKMGQLLGGIHGDVPAYEKIGPSMERFFSKIEVGHNVKRTNVGDRHPSERKCLLTWCSGLYRLMQNCSTATQIQR